MVNCFQNVSRLQAVESHMRYVIKDKHISFAGKSAVGEEPGGLTSYVCAAVIITWYVLFGFVFCYVTILDLNYVILPVSVISIRWNICLTRLIEVNLTEIDTLSIISHKEKYVLAIAV